jgi:hypothetical protein
VEDTGKIICRSSLRHVGDAIKDLHHRTAVFIKRRYSVIDGRVVVQPAQSAEAAPSEPQDDSDWYHVQQTSAEKGGVEALVDKEICIEVGAEEPTKRELSSPQVADGECPTLAMESVSYGGLKSGGGEDTVADRGEEGATPMLGENVVDRDGKEERREEGTEAQAPTGIGSQENHPALEGDFDF